MTRINDGFIRKNQHFFLDTPNELRIIATLKVSPADAAIEKHVTCKQDMRLGIVKDKGVSVKADLG